MIVHLSLLGIMALIAFPGRSSSEFSAVVTIVEESARELDREPLTQTLALPSGGATGENLSASDAFLSQSAQADHDASPRAELARPLELGMTGLAAGNLAEKVAPLASQAGRSGGEGTGDSSGQGGKEFFGLNVTANSVVFVVDNSRSMNYPHPGPAKTRLGRVKLELLHAIAQMTEAQNFFIIYFNSEAVPMPASRMMAATPSAKSHFLEWAAKVKAEGGTDPEHAMHLALSLRPEEIYFLTDGIFKRSAVPKILDANRLGIPIHTICFGDDRGEAMMQQIANVTGATYKFVPDGDQPQPESQNADWTEE
jgi:hypothetical protein